MNIITTVISKLDHWQRHHRLTAFGYAVIKKYGDDQGGFQAALLTYYAFLALFPLLLVLTTVTQLIANHYPHLQATILKATTDYFPVLGAQLSSHVQALHKSSALALIFGLLFTVYGAKGVADAFRYAANQFWYIPRTKRDGFPKSLGKSLLLIIVGGGGFVGASIISGLAAGAGHGWDFRVLSLIINVTVLFWLFSFLINVSLPKHVSLKDVRSGALTAALGLVVLQVFGSYLLRRELKSLDALYSYFAIALGLLFWIYLQAQIICYSLEIAATRSRRLWPRSIADPKTPADERVLALRQKI